MARSVPALPGSPRACHEGLGWAVSGATNLSLPGRDPVDQSDASRRSARILTSMHQALNRYTMKPVRTLPAVSITLGLALFGALTAAGCTSDPQPAGSISPETGGSNANGGQSNATSDAKTGGSSATTTKGSKTNGQGGKSTTSGSAVGGGKANSGGSSSNDDTSEANGGSTSGNGESSCVSGVNTGSACDPAVDTSECVRSTRTCTCEASGSWNCTATSGAGGASGRSETIATGGSSASSAKTGSGGTSSTSTKAVGGTGGGLGGGTSAATTASPTNEYCPASEPCRISPLGDSITEGMGWTPPGAPGAGGGYRVKLFGLANADGKNFTFVGTRSNGPSTVDGKPFPQKHEGTSGITIEGLQKVIDGGALTNAAVKPHIILLHLGTNNMYNSHPDTPEALLAKFLDKVIADCPDALLVVAKLIPLPMNASGIDSLNSKIPGLVEERAKKGAHIIMVDQFTGFPTSELGDQVHPNETGYARMAGVWYKAISQYLH